jgi:hypothetical protein
MTSELVVLCDFAENCSFILQDEAQGPHWNSAQATVHPCITYFEKSVACKREEEDLGMISDCLKHDSVLVHTFQWRLMKYIENAFQLRLQKNYFCGGSAAQYENKEKFTKYYVCCNEKFGVPAEWHFFVTSHGKSACDGVGGILKRLAPKSSLR